MSVPNYQAPEPEVQIGFTAVGLARLYVLSDRAQIPLDFTPDETEALADRSRSAAAEARSASLATSSRAL